MIDFYLMRYLFYKYLIKASKYLFKHRKFIAVHIFELGKAGYTGAFVTAVLTGLNINVVSLFLLGVVFTALAYKLERS